MGTIQGRVAHKAATRRFLEELETERWVRCADAMDVMNEKSYYPELPRDAQLREARQTLGIIANGGTISFEDPSVQRARTIGQ